MLAWADKENTLLVLRALHDQTLAAERLIRAGEHIAVWYDGWSTAVTMVAEAIVKQYSP